MVELIKKFIEFFENQRISISRKITIPLLVILCIFLIDNLLGISYYWKNEMEIDYISKIEDTKLKCTSDTIIIKYLEHKMDEAIQRKNVFQWFASLFENVNIVGTQEFGTSIANDTLHNLREWFPELDRNQMWHTITSSLCFILLLSISLLMVIYFPFTSDKDKFGTTVAFIFISGILVLFIWVFQWIWGLIPVILNRAYINYSIQLIFNLLLISGIILFIVNDNKKVKKVK